MKASRETRESIWPAPIDWSTYNVSSSRLSGLYLWGGQYRTIHLNNGDQALPAPHLVPAFMIRFAAAVLRRETLCTGNSLEEVVLSIVRMQAEFLAIAPFSHGNGRIIRLATGLLAVQAIHRFPLYTFADHGRELYAKPI